MQEGKYWRIPPRCQWREVKEVLKFCRSTETHFWTDYYNLWLQTTVQGISIVTTNNTASTYLTESTPNKSLSRGLSPSAPSYSSNPGIFSENGWHSSNSALLLHTSSGCSELYPDSSTPRQSQAFREGQTEKLWLKDEWKEANEWEWLLEGWVAYWIETAFDNSSSASISSFLSFRIFPRLFIAWT